MTAFAAATIFAGVTFTASSSGGEKGTGMRGAPSRRAAFTPRGQAAR